MEHSEFPPHKLIDESILMHWEVIGAGGFGQVNKVRHIGWCCDVAVKVLRNDDGNNKALLREVKMMREGSGPHIIRVLGVFRGRPPSSQLVQMGLVMELMERGSLASMQATLSFQSPPWTLVFRLAYQVALGINFLHSLEPPLLHLDLKPSNVLLDSFLNAKLTDFGLARHTVTVSKEDRQEGGTISYMPPEAFETSYKPTQAFDIYSYGILLWSIITGKIPYESVVAKSLIHLHVPKGERPPLKEIFNLTEKPKELTGLVTLMETCWEGDSDQRPSSQQCANEVEGMYKPHKHAIVDAVYWVLKKMDASEQGLHCGDSAGISVSSHPPVQEEAGGWTGHKGRISRLKDSSQTQLSETDSGHNNLKPSSANPMPPLRSSTQGRTQQSLQQSPRQAQPHARITAGPEALLPSNRNKPANRQVAQDIKLQSSYPNVNFNQCSISTVQLGNNNVMNINASRKERHLSAPSSIPSRQQNKQTPGQPWLS